jgi:Tfp pilus assembly protein PilX
MPKFQNQQGVSLYLSIVILFIFLGISLGLSVLLISRIKMIRSVGDSIVAFYAADAGVEQMLFMFRPSSRGKLANKSRFKVWAECSPGLSSPCPQGYKTSSNCRAPHYCVTSEGSVVSSGLFPKTKRAIQIEY